MQSEEPDGSLFEGVCQQMARSLAAKAKVNRGRFEFKLDRSRSTVTRVAEILREKGWEISDFDPENGFLMKG